MTQTNTHSGRKNWGFLAFTFGCIIAISGGAKLHPQDSLLRTRELLLTNAQRTTNAAMKPMVAKVHLSLTAAKLSPLSDADVRDLLQQTYTAMLQFVVKQLNIQHHAAVQGILDETLVTALLQIWKTDKHAAPLTKKKSMVVRDVLAQVVKDMTNPPKPPTKKVSDQGIAPTTSKAPELALAKLPISKPVQDMVGILQERVVARLSPYLLWYAIEKSAQHKTLALAHELSIASIEPLYRLGLQQLSAKDAQTGVVRVWETLARTLGKELRLLSADYALPIPPSSLETWATLLQKPLGRDQSLQQARQIAHAAATQIATHFSRKLADITSSQMRLFWHVPRLSFPKGFWSGPKIGWIAPDSSQTKSGGVSTGQKRAIVTSQPVTRPVTLVGSQPTATPVTPVSWHSNHHLTLGGTQERIGGWPDSLPFFLVGVVLAMIGLMLWRSALKVEATEQTETQTLDESNPFVLLAGVQAPLEQLRQEIDKLEPTQICDRVDELLSRYVQPFVELRQKVIDRLGMQTAADILVAVAYGERMLNRVWSAASDEHLGEVRSVLPDAINAFVEALQKAKASGVVG